jgi:sugar (glycoside-pentoside-hexuronide) transporter
MTNSEDKIPQAIKIGWAIGELGVAFYIGVSMAFFMFFLTEALSVSPAYAGIALFVPRLWDAITDPLMGIISDKTHSKMGRRRPYLLLGSGLFAVSFWLTLSPPSGLSETGYVIYFSIMYILVGTSFTIFDIPYSAMAAEMTSDSKERTKLIGYKMIGARLGIILAAFVSPIVYLSEANLKDGFALLGAIGGVFIFVSCVIAFITTKNAKRMEPSNKEFSLKNLRPFFEMRQLASNKHFVRLFSVFMLQNISIGAGASTLIYFVIITLKQSPATMGPLFALAGTAALVATPVWVFIGNKIGKKAAYTRAMIFNTIIICFAFFLSDEYFFLIYGLYVMMGFADAGNQLMSNSMVPDTVEYDQQLTGERREGIIFGAWAFCRKFGMAFGALMASFIMSIFGFVSNSPEQSEMAQLSIRIAYAVVPAVLWLGAIFLLRKYSLEED